MIKRIFLILSVLTVMLSAVSCADSGGSVKANNKAAGVDDVLKQYETTQSATQQDTETETEQKSSSNIKKADIDLTELNSNMVYSEVYNIISNPSEYVGKTFRMKGAADIYKDKKTKKTYYSCIIKDAAACCANGLEFKLSDKNSYPKRDEEVTVYGVFDTYKEDKVTYCVIKNAKLES